MSSFDCSIAKLSFSIYPTACYHAGIKTALLYPSQIPHAVGHGAVNTLKVSKWFRNKEALEAIPAALAPYKLHQCISKYKLHQELELLTI